MKLLIYWWTNL